MIIYNKMLEKIFRLKSKNTKFNRFFGQYYVYNTLNDIIQNKKEKCMQDIYSTQKIYLFVFYQKLKRRFNF